MEDHGLVQLGKLLYRTLSKGAAKIAADSGQGRLSSGSLNSRRTEASPCCPATRRSRRAITLHVASLQATKSAISALEGSGGGSESHRPKEVKPFSCDTSKGENAPSPFYGINF